jgi:hypothetical protein
LRVYEFVLEFNYVWGVHKWWEGERDACGKENKKTLRATSHTRLKALRAFIGRKGKDHLISLHTKRWRPKKTQRDYHGWKVYTDFYVENYKQEVDLTQIWIDHVSGTSFGWESRALAVT